MYYAFVGDLALFWPIFLKLSGHTALEQGDQVKERPKYA
jgi:hypothetical protein